MKILYLSVGTKMDNYNCEHVHTFSLAKPLALLGNKITLIINGEKIKVINKHNLEIYISKLYFSKKKESFLIKIYMVIIRIPRLLLLIFKNIDIKSYDVIYERYDITLFNGLILSLIFNKPLITEVNGIADEEFCIDVNFNHRFIQRIVTFICGFQLKRSTRVIVQTPELKEILRRKFSINNICVVENGVNKLKLHMNTKQNDILTLVYVGALDKIHNPEIVFKPISTIKENFEFFIIGKGEYFKKYITKYHNDKRFIFVQGLQHNKVLDHILNSDICIGSYDPKYPLFDKYGYYLCSLKLLEYAAAGKPSIIYSLSNTFLAKFENANACLVVNSRKDFISKLLNLMQNKELRDAMGNNAKKMVTKYSWENAAKKTEEILKQRNLKMQATYEV